MRSILNLNGCSWEKSRDQKCNPRTLSSPRSISSTLRLVDFGLLRRFQQVFHGLLVIVIVNVCLKKPLVVIRLVDLSYHTLWYGG